MCFRILYILILFLRNLFWNYGLILISCEGLLWVNSKYIRETCLEDGFYKFSWYSRPSQLDIENCGRFEAIASPSHSFSPPLGLTYPPSYPTPPLLDPHTLLYTLPSPPGPTYPPLYPFLPLLDIPFFTPYPSSPGPTYPPLYPTLPLLVSFLYPPLYPTLPLLDPHTLFYTLPFLSWTYPSLYPTLPLLYPHTLLYTLPFPSWTHIPFIILCTSPPGILPVPLQYPCTLSCSVLLSVLQNLKCSISS